MINQKHINGKTHELLVVNLGHPTVCTRLVTFVSVVFPC